jgi:hypothetical protein
MMVVALVLVTVMAVAVTTSSLSTDHVSNANSKSLMEDT